MPLNTSNDAEFAAAVSKAVLEQIAVLESKKRPENVSGPASDALLTKPEVAKLLRVTTKTVERYMAQRRLPYIKLGRTVRFERAAVEALKQRFTVMASR